jgi:hypothetical protein
MKTFVVLLFLTLFPPLIGSSGDSSSASSRSSERSPVALRVKADCAVFPLTISSDQKESDYQLYELGEARKHLVESLAGNPKLKVAPGLGQLDAREHSGSSLGLFSGGSLAKMDVTLRYTLPDGADLISCAREVGKIVHDISIPKNALYKYSVGNPSVWVESTSAHRLQLLKLIMEDTNQIKSIFAGASNISVSGLSDPVRQREVDDSHVELYIDYRVTVELGEHGPP